MRLDLLQLILRHAETVPEAEFNMQHWWKRNCTTVGCVIGHACQLPKIQEAGLTLKEMPPVGSIVPSYGQRTGYEAIAECLKINRYDAERLFAPQYNYVADSKQHVLNRIRGFIEQEGARRGQC